ncbi:MAG: 50S ribosomal protein L24 [Oscillospiraceae bacterium]|nr:50S ribosomal protein L24 [Oscillospiraceae bacterium]
MSKMHVRKGDTVMIISGKGKDVGKTGKVLQVSPNEGKIIVEKRNMVIKHVKPKQAGQQGGIVDAEGAFYACKAQLYCTHCDKPTRAGHRFDKDGKKERFCVKCKKEL